MGAVNFTVLSANSPSFGGYYYSINGTYIGHIDDPDKDISESVNVFTPAPIEAALIIKTSASNSDNIATIKDLVTKGAFTVRRIDLSPTKFSNELFLDRCAWVFGEGMGCFPRHYAFTMQNGFQGNNRSEKSLYFWLMREKINGVVQVIPKEKYMKYLNGKKFEGARNAPLSRNDEERAIIAAVLESILEPANDPTHGCNQWRGADTQDKGGHVIQGICKGKWHIFTKINKRTVQDEIITNTPSW